MQGDAAVAPSRRKRVGAFSAKLADARAAKADAPADVHVLGDPRLANADQHGSGGECADARAEKAAALADSASAVGTCPEIIGSHGAGERLEGEDGGEDASAAASGAQGSASGALGSDAAVATTDSEASYDDDPSADVLVSLLRELLRAYEAPSFQQDLAQLRARCANTGASQLQLLGSLALEVQAPILQKHGLEPTAQGVDRMKHAVQRRVAEGAAEVETLANATRRALGLAALPARGARCELLLERSREETALRCEGMAARQRCLKQLQKDCDAGLLPLASAAWLEGLVSDEGWPLSAVLALAKMARLPLYVDALRATGPGDPLPPHGRDETVESVRRLHAPTCEDFFTDFVMPNRPVVLEGCFDDSTFQPLRDFSDMAFLRRSCGQRRVLVKSLSHENGRGCPVFVSDPELKLPFGAFLDAVQVHASGGSRIPFYLGKVPLQKELPELADAIDRASTCPRRRYGGCFGKLTPDGVFTYFGCRRNTTSTHFDAYENLLLCVAGTKRLWLYPPSASRFLYPCKDFSRSAVPPFARHGSLPHELQTKFALLRRARLVEVLLRAGDLLYLPCCWWHCVEGSDAANMILNWWFYLHPEKVALASQENDQR
eukprot:TRINITY_DN16787_c0_g1_i2.p1 TRINITY_DN16787_c0_g1~~TRINITY_DN16787_c0_g1_i2.p1  ORF type:complete len:608 (+),score=128.03 TRINITY_DN16787_c0_g1_i2:36-1859(+)